MMRDKGTPARKERKGRGIEDGLDLLHVRKTIY